MLEEAALNAQGKKITVHVGFPATEKFDDHNF